MNQSSWNILTETDNNDQHVSDIMRGILHILSYLISFIKNYCFSVFTDIQREGENERLEILHSPRSQTI